MRLVQFGSHAAKPLSGVWVNVDHLVTLAPIVSETGTSLHLSAEFKLEGLPIQRIKIGDYETLDAAAAAWANLIASLQNPES